MMNVVTIVFSDEDEEIKKHSWVKIQWLSWNIFNRVFISVEFFRTLKMNIILK